MSPQRAWNTWASAYLRVQLANLPRYGVVARGNSPDRIDIDHVRGGDFVRVEDVRQLLDAFEDAETTTEVRA